MDFIKKLFGGILSLLAGIFRVFNIFKKSEYFLEADDVKSIGSAQPAQVQPAKSAATSSVKSAAELTPRSVNSNSAKAAQAVEPTPANGVAPVVAVAATTGAVENGKVVQPVAAAATAVTKVDPQPGAATPVAAAPTPIPATPSDATPAVFAPNYLGAPTIGGRRRPGPSMNRFLDMAKQVKA
ncbi:MAG: hypothetical protein HC881_03075 [Leptolyngbyaceae cyanobacterium SL_7_1]|nr:hypothetical protein [Leptolyngbyaceae cyanobacterium SL_7_1]